MCGCVGVWMQIKIHNNGDEDELKIILTNTSKRVELQLKLAKIWRY